MNAHECRRKAQYFLTLSRQMSRPKDRAAMVEMAALWMGPAERFIQQQKREHPVKEPEPSRKLVSQS